MKKKIYQLVCIYPQDHESYGESEFILGTYISEKRAIEVKDEVERQAIDEGMGLEYRINEYTILDWEE